MTKATKKEVQPEAHMVCDEGGTHVFRTKKEATCCDKCLCACCFPCYALCSCLLSEGAALANPFFEQICCKSRNDGDQGNEGVATCTKCGLTEREAIDLSDARDMEASQGNRNTGYFSNAMSLPSAGVTNQNRSSMPAGGQRTSLTPSPSSPREGRS